MRVVVGWMMGLGRGGVMRKGDWGGGGGVVVRLSAGC